MTLAALYLMAALSEPALGTGHSALETPALGPRHSALENRARGGGHAALDNRALGTGHSALEGQAVAGECRAPSAECRPNDVIASIHVHGNLVETTEDIIAMSGVAVGSPFAAGTIGDVAARLKASGKFRDVQVLKRYAALEDPSRIALVIIVDEGPVRLTRELTTVRQSRLRNVMVMPILDAEDGYGLTYGARAAYVGAVGRRSRVSVPLTWGGLKQAGVDVERRIGPAERTRVIAGAGIGRRRNPAFDEQDTRRRTWVRIEHASGPVRGGATAAWERVAFGPARDRVRSIGVDAAVDTRLDPVRPRNAVLASVAWDRLTFDARAVDRTRVEGRGYLGLIGRTVLALRLSRESSNGPLPDSLKPLLGGWSTLRGFRAGAFAGDTLVAGSVELRIPLSSPTRVRQFGASLFTDAGKSYDYGDRFRDQPWRQGTGGSLWFAATVLHAEVSVARGHGSDTRVNFGAGLTF